MLIYALTIFASAFLLFLVQPIMAKQILPWFGGSAAVWTTCLMFFQLILLFGYAYADWTVRFCVACCFHIRTCSGGGPGSGCTSNDSSAGWCCEDRRTARSCRPGDSSPGTQTGRQPEAGERHRNWRTYHHR